MDIIINLKWLDGKNKSSVANTWGVPWERGKLEKNQAVNLRDGDGNNIPMQSWPLAYWPDGSIKWTAHAAVFEENTSENFALSKGEGSCPKTPLKSSENDEFIEVETDNFNCRISKSGSQIISHIKIDDNIVCSGGKLVAIRQENGNTDGLRSFTEEDFVSEISSASIEQAGEVRCVVKIDGKHIINFRDRKYIHSREWIPFTLRLYFYAGVKSFKAVYTMFYDGNPNKDFIKGLGLSFNIPLDGALYNRHVFMSGDTGFYCDSPKSIANIRANGKYQELLKEQLIGKAISFDPQEDANFLRLIDDSATWSNFSLAQLSSNTYFIHKQTKNLCSRVKGYEGNRAGGMAYAGSQLGGLAVGVRNFWQKNPSSIEINGMDSDNATMNIWLWSPEAQAMDLRHYDTETHVVSSYEGFEEMRSTPYGVANTSEIFVYCFDETPSPDLLKNMLNECQNPSQIVCLPEHYHDTHAFGVWSLINKNTPIKEYIENQMDNCVEFFKTEIEQRKWYGFWNFGDMMRSYDATRHTWKYDIGGCAWNNSEIVPNMWLWYVFLRSGRADVFRLAESFTRHASEVDQYHFGEYAMLGSRHNVVHWGCGCKEARVSMAFLHRFYYYLTADERIGDILDEVKDADYTIMNLDPLRSILPKDQYPTHARSSPDWAAFSSNMLTRWERFEDISYRDKLYTGINCLNSMPYKLNSGPFMGYDAKTGMLYHMGDDNSSFHMNNCFGAPATWLEFCDILQDEKWNEMIADYGEFYIMPIDEKQKLRKDIKSNRNYGMADSVVALSAFASKYKKDKALAKRTWKILLESIAKYKKSFKYTNKVDNNQIPYPLEEYVNADSGVGLLFLNAIFCLEFIGESLDDDVLNNIKA